MRNTFILAAAISLVACQNDPTESVQYQQLQSDKEMLEQRNIEKDASMEELFDSFNRINDNIAEIKSRQFGLTQGSTNVESGKNMEEQIMEDLKAIDDLMEQNKRLVAQLKKNSRKDDLQINALEKTIKGFEDMLATKDTEIGSLKERLSSANSSLATLMDMYQEQTQLVDSQEGALNKAYFALGTSKELKDNGIVSKTGGIAGVGGAKTLNMTDLNKAYFEEVDITATSTIPVMAKKAKLISSHPEGSYAFDANFDKLNIKDADAFWSVSKYLVIEVD